MTLFSTVIEVEGIPLLVVVGVVEVQQREAELLEQQLQQEVELLEMQLQREVQVVALKEVDEDEDKDEDEDEETKLECDSHVVHADTLGRNVS